MSEPYLGWAFAGLLAQEEGRTAISPVKRQKFLKVLSEAKFIPRFTQLAPGVVSPKLGSLADYSLEQSSRARDVELGDQIEFHDWLKIVRQGGYFPSIFFPPKPAGPDIVFSLKHKTEDKRILFAIQLKTGTANSKAFHLIKTIDPNLWFAGHFYSEYELYTKELEKHRPQLTILTMVIVTSASCKAFFEEPEVFRKILESLQNWVHFYTIVAQNQPGIERTTAIQNVVKELKMEYQQATAVFSQETDTNKKAKLEERVRQYSDTP